jgi:enterochelin esterase-like enzyme
MDRELPIPFTHPRHYCVTLLAALALTAAVPAQVAGDCGVPPADLRVSKSLAKRLVKNWLYGTMKRRASAVETLIRTRPKDRMNVAAAISARNFQPPRMSRKERKLRDRIVTLKLTEGRLGEGRFLIQLPAKYNGKKPYPLVVRLHEGGGDGMGYAKSWTSVPTAEQFIAVTPTIPSGDRMSWVQRGSAELLDLAYKHMLAHYNIDTDRVYLAGHSAGGGAAFLYAQVWPHRLAAVFSRSLLYYKFDRDWEGCIAVLEYVPGFYVVGLDQREEEVEGFRRAEAFFKKHGYPAAFRFEEGRGHEYIKELDEDGFPFLLKQRRIASPKEFHAFFFAYSDDNRKRRAFHETQYWLKATNYNPRGTPVKVSVEDNTVRIEGKGLDAGVLRLNDGLVNLDQDVVVMLNGREVHRGRVERSIRFLLDEFERTPDPKRLWWNRLEFKK